MYPTNEALIAEIQDLLRRTRESVLTLIATGDLTAADVAQAHSIYEELQGSEFALLERMSADAGSFDRERLHRLADRLNRYAPPTANSLASPREVLQNAVQARFAMAEFLAAGTHGAGDGEP